MRIDLDSLEALDAVVREGGVARAAAVLNKAQSAISYHLRQLETRLGLSLIDRDGYRVRLTPQGEAVLAEGRRLLAQARRVEGLAREFAEGWEARLLVIIDGILPLDPILHALKVMGDENAPTRIQLKVEFLHGVQHRFEKDAADLMLVKDYTPQPWLAADPLPDITCVLCVGAGHPLADAGVVDLADLQEHVELSIQDSSDQGDDRHMFGGERVFYLSDFAAKQRALRLGLGFGWAPLFQVREDLERGALREVRYAAGSRYSFTPNLVHRQDRPLGPAGRKLSQLIIDKVTEVTT